MKNLLAFLFMSMIFVGFSQDQQQCPCCTESHSQFDFWIGEWNVYDTSGTLIGENEIVSLEDHCIISERWTGGKGTTGRSYNYYNGQDQTWNQVWVDNGGNPLVLKGSWNGKAMVLKGEILQGKQVKNYRNVVSWTPQSDGSVIQLWELHDADGTVLREIFKGVYKKK